MFTRWMLTELLFIADVTMVLITATSSLPTVADAFESQLRIPPGAPAAQINVDNECNLVVSRGSNNLTSTQTQTGHYSEITVTLTAFNETFVLDLKLNKYLLASTYTEKAITKDGEVYNEVNHITDHCYYTGEVRNRSPSTAAVSTCNGITGYFAIGNVSYHIEANGDDLNSRHKVVRSHDDVKNLFKCGTDDHLGWMPNIHSTESFGRSGRRMKRSFLYPQDEDRVDKVVEVYVANDRSQFLARSSNIQNVYRRMKDIVNTASLAYQSLGIYVVLVGAEVWTTSDRIRVRDSDATETLYSWYKYRKNSITPNQYNDIGILFTNVNFNSGAVGKSDIGTMCANQNSGAIISDLSSQAAVAGTTMAHEMGHCFGVNHDTAPAQCKCDDPPAKNYCIMSTYTDTQRLSTKWSECSRTQFANSFSQGLDICLYNIPKTIYQTDSTCGNGIVETGEDCDCGRAPNSECNADCCNIVTCRLTASATCASGRCCDRSTCKIKSSGTECRSKSNDCDLPEYCDGVDARCPTDSYKPDGTDCTNIDPAYCYEGQCRSHRSQCELLWGPGNLVSHDYCYTIFNPRGKDYGNCGIKWKENGVDYISCAPNDAKCGLLMCNNGSATLQFYKRYSSISGNSIGSYTCHSVIFDFGIATQDPGLVPNGAKCGDRQMCVNQKCVKVAQSSDSMLPTTSAMTTESFVEKKGNKNKNKDKKNDSDK